MYIGIDLGTSGVKSIAMSRDGDILASQTVKLTVSRPNELWSEQNPTDWWQATCESISGLSNLVDLAQVKAIGLSGQMHGATLLDVNGDIIRPAILWNDGRCEEECRQLEAEVPNSRSITGNIMMPGFTAPKLKWVANHEPTLFAQINKVLLPKDYLRFKMTGDFASDMSDSAGTLWLDVEKRDWNDDLLAATGLARRHMPKLFEGNEITGVLSEEIAIEWGMTQVPVIAGGGDNAAGAIGVGIINPGQAMLSLGTSGVYFAVSDQFISNPESALHSFCHALPNTCHTMSVILSAASCLQWVADLTDFDDVGTMLAEVEQNADPSSSVIFLPYLSGERTPHNNPNAKGVFFGMTHTTTKLELAQAVLEGVGFAFADGFDALHVTKSMPEEVSLIGGGARSQFWRQMLADIVNMPLVYRKGGDVGPALGAARLAILGVEPNANLADVCPVPELVQRHEPNIRKVAEYQAKRKVFQSLYTKLQDLF
ncbi:xylulokinase [Vibrio crassostreae]|uniref:xylulokinase n=1 Tax=Vibrio crassostreae TaxID=246167 RepID=UPI000314C636|nr:xylulokinase [Vibrio crassostreae]OED88029.1 xylulokinase [Vibrio crassostreae ZF-91]